MAVESRGDLESRHGSIGRIAVAHSWSYRSEPCLVDPCTFVSDFALRSRSRAGRRESPIDVPWGVCAVERQHRDRQASLAHPFDSVDGRFDLQLTWFAGVDWGFQKHQVCVLDDAGKVLGEQEFGHGGARLSEMANWLLSFAAGEAGEVGVTIETPLAKSCVRQVLQKVFPKIQFLNVDRRRACGNVVKLSVLGETFPRLRGNPRLLRISSEASFPSGLCVSFFLVLFLSFAPSKVFRSDFPLQDAL